MTDNQIMSETFLEDVNNILNTGEITNLYESADYERMAVNLEKDLMKKKIPINEDSIYQYYIESLRDYFHIILCMSPVGD